MRLNDCVMSRIKSSKSENIPDKRVGRVSPSNVSSVRMGVGKQKCVIRMAGYETLSPSEKRTLRLGKGFVRVPDEERARQRIDAYSYLIR